MGIFTISSFSLTFYVSLYSHLRRYLFQNRAHNSNESINSFGVIVGNKSSRRVMFLLLLFIFPLNPIGTARHCNFSKWKFLVWPEAYFSVCTYLFAWPILSSSEHVMHVHIAHIHTDTYTIIFEDWCAPSSPLSGISLRIVISLTLELYHSLFSRHRRRHCSCLFFFASSAPHSRLLIWNRNFLKVIKFNFLHRRHFSTTQTSFSLSLPFTLYIPSFVRHIQYSYALSLCWPVSTTTFALYFHIFFNSLRHNTSTWNGNE